WVRHSGCFVLTCPPHSTRWPSQDDVWEISSERCVRARSGSATCGQGAVWAESSARKLNLVVFNPEGDVPSASKSGSLSLTWDRRPSHPLRRHGAVSRSYDSLSRGGYWKTTI